MENLTLYEVLIDLMLIAIAIYLGNAVWDAWRPKLKSNKTQYDYNQAVGDMIQQIWNLEVAFMKLNDLSDKMHENSKFAPYIKMLGRIREQLQRYEIMFNKTWKGQRMNPEEVHYILSKYAILQNVMETLPKIQKANSEDELRKLKGKELHTALMDKIAILSEHTINNRDFSMYLPNLSTNGLYYKANALMKVTKDSEELQPLNGLMIDAINKKIKEDTEAREEMGINLSQRVLNHLRSWDNPLVTPIPTTPDSGYMVLAKEIDNNIYPTPLTLIIKEEQKDPKWVLPQANRIFTLSNGIQVEVEYTYNP